MKRSTKGGINRTAYPFNTNHTPRIIKPRFGEFPNSTTGLWSWRLGKDQGEAVRRLRRHHAGADLARQRTGEVRRLQAEVIVVALDEMRLRRIAAALAPIHGQELATEHATIIVAMLQEQEIMRRLIGESPRVANEVNGGPGL